MMGRLSHLCPTKTNGVAELAQVISGRALGGNLTLYRLRFDVIGVGTSSLQILDAPGGSGLTNPGAVVHTLTNGSFDSETYFDPSHTLNWNANITLPSPLVPGSPNTFRADSTCSGCTGPFTYAWQFNSSNTTPMISQFTGNQVTATMPNSTFQAYRLTVMIRDSAAHNINLTVSL